MQGVQSSPVFRWFLILLLPLTLGLKTVVQIYGAADASDSDATLKIAQFLSRQHFSVEASDRLREGLPAVLATAANCKVRIIPIAPEAWHRDMFAPHIGPDDAVFTVFNGQVYSEQPKWRTLMSALWDKFRRELGLRTRQNPTLTVIATKGCSAERLPWAELAKY